MTPPRPYARPDPARCRSPLRAGVAALAMLVVAPSPAAAGEPEDLARLAAMPPERRRELAANLGAFDRLPADERAAIRKLDAELAGLPDDERSRLVEVMRRYRHWLDGLDPKRREQVEKAPVDKRAALVQQFRAEDAQAARRRFEAVWVRSSTTSPVSVFETAYLIQVWFAIDPDERAAFESQRGGERIQPLARLGQQKGLRRDLRPLLDELEALRGDVDSGVPTKALGLARRDLDELRTLLQDGDFPERPAALKKAIRGAPNVMRLIEARFLRKFDPAPVGPAELARFEASLPSILTATIDPLPPDAARRRLTILYRLAFGDGPMPDIAPARPPAASTPAPRKPAAPTATPTPRPF